MWDMGMGHRSPDSPPSGDSTGKNTRASLQCLFEGGIAIAEDGCRFASVCTVLNAAIFPNAAGKFVHFAFPCPSY